MVRLTMSLSLLIAAVLVVASAALRSGSSAELAVSGRSNGNASIAASGPFIAIAWGATTKDGTTDVYTAVSRDGASTFSTPVAVNDAATTARLSGEQPPRISLVPRAGQDPSVVVVWTSPATAGTRLLSARSDDGGRTFTRPVPLPGSNAPGNRGWEATATDASGRVAAIWLDHRELAKPAEDGTAAKQVEHQHGARGAQEMDGTARAQLSKLYFARLDNVESVRTLTDGVCYCCKTTIATGGNGAIYAAWRHVYPGNIRDIAFTMSADGGRTFAPPTRVSEDNWMLNGCPENGPAMAVDASGRIHVIWPTLVPGETPASEPTLALFYATSRDGRRFTPRQRIPAEGFAGHSQIALGPRDTVIAAWEERASGTRRVALGRGTFDDAGTIRFVRQVISDSAPARNPALATTADGVVAVWTSGASGQTVLRTRRLPY